MPTVYLLNQTPQSANHSFSLVWKLTRALKKAGWRVVASANGTTKDSYSDPALSNPENDKWNGTGSSTGNTGSAASLTSKTLDDITVTGLTGMSAASVGRYLTITGANTSANNGTFQIVSYVSATSVVIRNAAGSSGDANNGSISWTERDYILETYPTALDSVAAWWVGQGPTTIKIPIPASTTGTFTRGEKITQTTSSAEGELLGVVLDTASTSFLVVLPRIGTFNTSDTITGALSSATVTPTGSSIVTFVEEVVFAKTTDIFNGWIYLQRVDASSESTSRFSYLAFNAAGCTATVAPGNGGTGNTFPTFAWMVRGTNAGSATSLVPSVTTISGNLMNGRFHAVATNTIGLEDQSPDGTFWIVHSVPGSGAANLGGLVHARMDDTEDGDVDPFVWFQSAAAPTRTANTGGNTDGMSSGTSPTMAGSTTGCWTGWRARGMGSNGTVEMFVGSLYPAYNAGLALSNALILNLSDPDRSWSHPGRPYVREPIWILGTTANNKVRKGTCRWVNAVQAGTAMDLWNSSTYIQVSPTTTSAPGLILGPWDGTTNPVYV